MSARLIQTNLTEEKRTKVGWLIGWFHSISNLVGLFNTKVIFFQAIKWFHVTNDNNHLQIIISSSNLFYINNRFNNMVSSNYYYSLIIKHLFAQNYMVLSIPI